MQVLAMFRCVLKLELLKVAKTRFVSHYILFKRIIYCREGLATTIVQKSWKGCLKNQDENTNNKAMMIANTVNNDEFWDSVEAILSFAKAYLFVGKFSNGDSQKIREIYEHMDIMSSGLYAD